MPDNSRNPQNTIERVAAWVAGLRLEDIPEITRERVRLQVATSLSAAAWAPWHEPSQTVLRTKRDPGNAMVFATGDRRSPAHAAYVNAAFAMSLDCDDYMLTGHTGHSAVQVSIAHAENLDAVVLAAAAANEVMGRISSMCLLGPLNGQMSSYIHNVGAAIALGKTLAFSKDQIASAIGLALYQPNYCLLPGFWNEDSKTITAAAPLEQGMSAARLAEAGLAGPLDLLDHPLGFFNTFSFTHFPGFFDGLGKVWFSDTLCYKRYPGTSYISAGVEGALRASENKPLRADDLQSVVVETTILSSTLDAIGATAIHRSPLDANAVNFSLRLSVAAALRFGDLTPAQMRPETLRKEENEIRAIAHKVTVIHDWSQTIELFQASPLGLRMIAHMRPGAVAQMVAHVQRIKKASRQHGAKQEVASKNRRALLSLPQKIIHNRRLPVTDLDIDPTAFKMLQSARTTLETTHNGCARLVEIPIGACGRDLSETRDLVRWRCENAFGTRGVEVFETIVNPGSTVEALYRVIENG